MKLYHNPSIHWVFHYITLRYIVQLFFIIKIQCVEPQLLLAASGNAISLVNGSFPHYSNDTIQTYLMMNDTENGHAIKRAKNVVPLPDIIQGSQTAATHTKRVAQHHFTDKSKDGRASSLLLHNFNRSSTENDEDQLNVNPSTINKINQRINSFYESKYYVFRDISFLLVIFSLLTFIYVCQVSIHLFCGFPWSTRIHPASCILSGGLFCGIGETGLVTLARSITSCFIHLSLLHYSSSAILLGCFIFFLCHDVSYSTSEWLLYWIPCVFLSCGIVKSIVTYYKSLYQHGVSSSSSGCVLGLCSYLWVFSALTSKLKISWPSHLVFLGCAVFSCCLLLWENVDWLALFVSSVYGALLALVLSNGTMICSAAKLKELGETSSYCIMAIVLLAYLEVVREGFIDSRELFVRCYVKSYILQDNGKVTKQRYTERSRELTEDLLFYLYQESASIKVSEVLTRIFKKTGQTNENLTELGGSLG